MSERRESDKRFLARVDPDLADLIPLFLESRRADLAALRRALAVGDFQAIRAVGHSMKGAGAAYGFDAVTDIGAALEVAALGGQAEAVRHQLDLLEEYLVRVQIVLE